jgi:hypothetical protein
MRNKMTQKERQTSIIYTCFMIFLAGLILAAFAAILVVAVGSAAVYVDPPNPPLNPVYLPWVGVKTENGAPYRVIGQLQYQWGEAYDCQLIRLAELWYYDPQTGEGYIILDNAFNPGDITDDFGNFILDEVLDENGIPYDIATTDHILIIGKPDAGPEGVAYDIIEWPLVLDVYAGQVVDVGVVSAKAINLYCWPDPDSGGVWEFETIGGEIVLKHSPTLIEVYKSGEISQ